MYLASRAVLYSKIRSAELSLRFPRIVVSTVVLQRQSNVANVMRLCSSIAQTNLVNIIPRENMSVPAKVTFAISCVISTGIIGYVHLKQVLDREKLHEGVIRDIERRQKRKAENIYILEKQKDITKVYLAQEE